MRHLVKGMLLSLCAACAGAPPAPEVKQEATARARALKAPARPAPPLPEAPDLSIGQPAMRADRALPGPCRERRIESFGTQSAEVQISRWHYDGDRARDVEAVDAGGGFLWRAEPKVDAEGRIAQMVERGSDGKAIATRTFERDTQGRVLRETYQKASEKKPSFERTVTRDGAGNPTSETWRRGTTTWKLAPVLDASGQVATLAREDGMVVARYLRDRQGNLLMESRLAPEGPETRTVADYGCFGVDETAASRMGELCQDDVHACVQLAKLLGEDAYSQGLAPDPALAEVYRIRACRMGDAASCLRLAERESDPERLAGFRYQAKVLSVAACKAGDPSACEHACELGDPPSCAKRPVASDEN